VRFEQEEGEARLTGRYLEKGVSGSRVDSSGKGPGGNTPPHPVIPTEQCAGAECTRRTEAGEEPTSCKAFRPQQGSWCYCG